MTVSKYCNHIARTSALGLGLIIAACMPSEYAYMASSPEQVEAWLQECEGNENDYVRKERFCDLAIKSGFASEADYVFAVRSRANVNFRQQQYGVALQDYNEAIKLGQDGDIYGDRAYVRAMLDDLEGARSDDQRAYRETGEQDFVDELAIVEHAYATSRYSTFYYRGFHCLAVQVDSVAHQPNEILVHVGLFDEYGMLYSKKYPDGREYYPNVTAGTGATSQEETGIVLNDAHEFSLVVSMWEHDDGGPWVDAAVFWGSTLGQAALTRSTISVAGRAVPYNRPTDGTSGAGVTSGIEAAVSSRIKSIAGTENDPIGTKYFHGLRAKDYVDSRSQSEFLMPFHFNTWHQQSGANCRAYFEFKPYYTDDIEDVNGDMITFELNNIRQVLRAEIGT